MILSNIIAQKSLTTIIAPHGITDIMHAREYNIVNRLYEVNAGTIIVTHFLHMGHLTDFVNAAFLLASIVHFRHDMPVVKNIPRFALSATMIPVFALCPATFFVYMLLIHVPNHYRMNWKYIASNLGKNTAILGIFTLLSAIGGELFFYYLMNGYMMDIMKSVVIAHIIYEETFIHNHHKPNILHEINGSRVEEL